MISLCNIIRSTATFSKLFSSGRKSVPVWQRGRPNKQSMTLNYFSPSAPYHRCVLAVKRHYMSCACRDYFPLPYPLTARVVGAPRMPSQPVSITVYSRTSYQGGRSKFVKDLREQTSPSADQSRHAKGYKSTFRQNNVQSFETDLFRATNRRLFCLSLAINSVAFSSSSSPSNLFQQPLPYGGI